MSYYPELISHIRYIVKVVLDYSNYATKKNQNINTFDLAVKKDFIVLTVEVDKLDINKLTKVPTMRQIQKSII